MWVNRYGKVPSVTHINIDGLSQETVENKIEKIASTDKGRYVLSWAYPLEKGQKEKDRKGHILTLERVGSDLIIYDPQNETFPSIGEIMTWMKQSLGFDILKIDNLLINTETVNKLVGSY